MADSQKYIMNYGNGYRTESNDDEGDESLSQEQIKHHYQKDLVEQIAEEK